MEQVILELPLIKETKGTVVYGDENTVIRSLYISKIGLKQPYAPKIRLTIDPL